MRELPGCQRSLFARPTTRCAIEPRLGHRAFALCPRSGSVPLPKGKFRVAEPPTETKVIGPRRSSRDGGARSGGDCLAIIHSRDETLLGKRIELGRAELVIGRGDAVDLSLRSESVSRR